MTKRKPQVYKKILKLPSSIGDWTKLKREDFLELKTSKEYLAKLSSTQLEKIHFFHYQFGNKLEKFFNETYNELVSLDEVIAEQLKCQSLIEESSNFFIQVNCPTNQKEVFIFFDSFFSQILVDYSLGGLGQSANQPLSLTKIETAVLEEVIGRILNEYRKFFGQYLNFYENVPQKISPVSKNLFSSGDDFLFLVSLIFNFQNSGKAKLYFAYPELIIKTLIESLERIGDNFQREVFLNEKTLEGIFVPVKSELGQTVLTTGELSKIRIGDVISLDKKAGSPVYVLIGEKVKLEGTIGVYDRHLSVQLISRKPKEKVIKAQSELLESQVEQEKYESKEGSEEMISEKYFDNEMSEYELDEEKEISEEELEEDYEEESEDLEEEAYGEDETENYGFLLDEE